MNTSVTSQKAGVLPLYRAVRALQKKCFLLSKDTLGPYRNCTKIVSVSCSKNSSSKRLGSQDCELLIRTHGLSNIGSVVFIPNLIEILFFDSMRPASVSLVQFVIPLIYMDNIFAALVAFLKFH
jgi:hypothetical protein